MHFSTWGVSSLNVRARYAGARAARSKSATLLALENRRVYSQTRSLRVRCGRRSLKLRVVLFQWFSLSRQRFIDRPLPFRDFMPFARHLAITGLDLQHGHSRGSTLALIRLLPTDIGRASHDAFSRSVLTEECENVIG